MNDTWHTRDLPVLRAIVQTCDDTMKPVFTRRLAELTAFDFDDVQRAIRNLAADGLVTFRTRGGAYIESVGEPTGEALRRAGAWPSPETAADKLLAALEAFAERGDVDEVERSKARAAAAALGSLSRDVFVSVVGAAAGVAMQ